MLVMMITMMHDARMSAHVHMFHATGRDILGQVVQHVANAFAVKIRHADTAAVQLLHCLLGAAVGHGGGIRMSNGTRVEACVRANVGCDGLTGVGMVDGNTAAFCVAQFRPRCCVVPRVCIQHVRVLIGPRLAFGRWRSRVLGW